MKLEDASISPGSFSNHSRTLSRVTDTLREEYKKFDERKFREQIDPSKLLKPPLPMNHFKIIPTKLDL